jgi:hypothetical protein
MAALTIKAFRGQVPRVSERLLEPNRAKRAMNCKITSGRLDPLRGLGLELTSSMSAIKSIFRYRAWSGSSYAEQWFTWQSDVDAVLSPIANDSVGRVYFTSEDFEPRMTTRAVGIGASGPYPSAWYALGVFAPTAAPAVASTGGSGTQESRTYVVTYVTPLGEESAPSPASSVVTGFINGTWTVSSIQTAPPNSGTVSAATVIAPANTQVLVTLDAVFGLEAGDTVTLSGVGGMTDLDKSHRIVSVDTVNNRIVVDLVTAQTYTSGGAWSKGAPHNTAGMTKRIYRSAGSVAAFLFVAEIPVATTSYTDAVATASLGESLPTSGFYGPPKDMTCLISLPNGCLVGLAGNELCFSEPSKPYAWPDQNRYSFAGRGVALVPAGNSVIVLTESAPILYTGSDPAGMSPSVMETYAPCVSKRGVANIGGGCIYPSFDGLWMAGPGVVQKVTTNLYRIEEWSKLNPSSMIADYYDNQYYARYIVNEQQRILVFNMNDRDSIVEVEESADAIYRNEFDGRMYIVKNDKVYAWDANEGLYYESDWRSVDVQLGRPLNFAVAQVHADFVESRPPDTAQIAANELLMADLDAVGGFICGDELLTLDVAGSHIIPAATESSRRVQLTLYKGDTAVFTKEVTSVKPFRLPAGYRTEVVSIGVNASSPTFSVTIAESFADLAGAS